MSQKTYVLWFYWGFILITQYKTSETANVDFNIVYEECMGYESKKRWQEVKIMIISRIGNDWPLRL